MRTSEIFIRPSVCLLVMLAACTPSGEQTAATEAADAGKKPAPTVHEVTILRTEVADPESAETHGAGHASDEQNRGDESHDDEADNLAALEADAKRVVGAFGQALKGQLVDAMHQGGPINAVGVCHTIAPALAAEASAANDVELTRVSLRHRNPQIGAPNAWQIEVLENFDQQKAAGADPATLVYSEVVGDEYRFMKAIPTEAPCLACHGEVIEPALAQKLSELYPGDQATGYRLGDVRGAFSLIKPL